MQDLTLIFDPNLPRWSRTTRAAFLSRVSKALRLEIDAVIDERPDGLGWLATIATARPKPDGYDLRLP